MVLIAYNTNYQKGRQHTLSANIILLTIDRVGLFCNLSREM